MTDIDEQETDTTTDEPRPRSPIEFRSAQVVGVKFPQRIVELIVMPYEQRALVEYHGRMIHEVCSRGAYDGVQRRANRVVANRDHDETKYCGRAVALHPSRTEGLVAEVRMFRNALGDETLAMADDGDLAASAGFAVMAEQWLEGRSLRRLDKCFLGHIGMTPEPAYEGAAVLSVRSMGQPITATLESFGTSTPNLDALRLADLARRFDNYQP